MPKSKNKFKLLPDEDIAIETKHIESKEEKIREKFSVSALGFGGLIILTIGFFIMFIDLNFIFFILRVLISITIIIMGFLILSMVIYLFSKHFSNIRTTFYATTTRMVQAIKKKDCLIIKKEIRLRDISHLIDWGHTLEVIPKKLGGKGYYRGNEEEIDPKAQNSMFHRIPNSIMIWLRGSRGKRVIKKIMKFLIENVPLKQHQNLEFLYIAEN